jgi:hypothetical protein
MQISVSLECDLIVGLPGQSVDKPVDNDQPWLRARQLAAWSDESAGVEN